MEDCYSIFRRSIKSWQRWLLTGCLCLLSLKGTAATNDSSWFVRAWRLEDGLPNNTVTGLAQTPDGYLWVSTSMGLARFDGVQFEEYSHTNYIAEPNRGVITLAQSRDGTLWLAMDRGPIVRLKAGAAKVFTLKDGLPDYTVNKLVEDGAGGVWLAYRNGTICRISLDDRVATYGGPGAPTGLWNPLATDNRGRFWLASGNQLYLFQGGKFASEARTAAPITGLAAARSGGVWLCAGSKLFQFALDRPLQDCGVFETTPADTTPTVMLEDHAGGVWMGTTYNGLHHYDGSTFVPVDTSNRGIVSLAEDREGNLWVGTSAGGLNRLRERIITLEGVDSGLPLESVQTISEGADGSMWAATQNGQLVCRSGGRWTLIPLPGGGATCVAADHHGGVWVGTGNRQLYHWQDGQVKTWGAAEGLEGRVLHSLLVSSTGDLWIGGPTAVVQRMRGGKLTSLRLPAANGVVRAMAEDQSGNIWVGTARGLLFRISGEVVSNETASIAQPPLSIRSLYPAPDGSLWIGFAGWGLGRLRDGDWCRLTTSEGLADDYISQIVADDRGWLWCGGDHGIFRVSAQQIEEFVAGRVSHVQCITYGQGEGLPGLQAASGLSPGALRDHEGRLWMPMRTALAIINPDQLREDREAPPVLIHRLVMDGETIAWYGGILPLPTGGRHPLFNLAGTGAADDELKLPPGHRRLEFDYTALSFKAPENVHFRYRLEGIDDDWVEGDIQRKVEYSRLPEGKYRFRVTACNSDGFWNDTGAAVSFVVLPYFWQTWWFRLTVVALFTTAMLAAGRYISYRRLRVRLELLERQTALEREPGQTHLNSGFFAGFEGFVLFLRFCGAG